MVRGGGGASDDDDDIADDDDDDDGESPPDDDDDDVDDGDAVGSSDDEADVEEDAKVDDVGGDDDDDDGDESEEASTSLSSSSSSSSSSPSRGTEIGGGGASAPAAPRQRQQQQQQQSRNFGIVTALWASLVFDTLLNKSKRVDLFPVATPSLLVPTALLSSGFALAFGVAFLLWRDMENRADEECGGDGGRMGDWFLSLTSRGTVDSSNDDDDEGDAAVAVASRTIRARLLLHLSVFGTLCLAGQSLGYRLSRAAPFLGLSAAAVNVHNVLACVSALTKKDEGGGSSGAMVRAALTRPVLSFRGGGEDVGKKRDRLTPFLFRLGAVAACARCIPACRRIHALASGLPLSGGVAESAMIVNDARQLSLQVASLARLTLFAGASNALHDATSSTSTCRDHFRNHPFFATLSGMMGLGCLGVGGTILFESFVVSPGCSSLANAVLSQAVVGGVLLMMFGLFASWNSVVGFERHLRVSGLTGKQGVESSV